MRIDIRQFFNIISTLNLAVGDFIFSYPTTLSLEGVNISSPSNYFFFLDGLNTLPLPTLIFLELMIISKFFEPLILDFNLGSCLSQVLERSQDRMPT
jgi:hypothetical protein